MLLALAGGVAGLLLAGWGIELLMAAIPNSLIVQMPYLEGLSLDVKVLGFTFALSLLTGIIFGLAPAYQSSKPDLNEALKEGSKSSTGIRRARLRSLLVVSEIALALVLLIGAGLMIKSLNRLLAVNPGFDTENLLTFELSLPMNRYSEADRVVAISRSASCAHREPAGSERRSHDRLAAIERRRQHRHAPNRRAAGPAARRTD